MDNTNVHIIKKQIFELEVADQNLAREVQDEVSYICRTRLIALIEKALNNVQRQLVEAGILSSENSVIRIDTLNLDLGDFLLDNMRDELAPRIERLIEEAVYEQAYQIVQKDKRNEEKKANDRDIGHGAVVESGQNEWQLLTYYLTNGNLPWWYKSTERIDWVTFIEDKYKEDKKMFTTSIVPLFQDDLVLNRLLFLMPWQNVIAYLTESITNPDRKRVVEKIIEIGAAFVKIQHKTPIINTSSRHQFEKTMVEVMMHLVVGKVELSIIKVEDVFIKELLIHWANISNITFDQLLIKLLELEISNVEKNQSVLPQTVRKQLMLFAKVELEITSLKELEYALSKQNRSSEKDKEIGDELFSEKDTKHVISDDQEHQEKDTKTSIKDDSKDKADHEDSLLDKSVKDQEEPVVDDQKKNESQRLSTKEEKEAKASIPDASKDKADHADSLLDKSVKDQEELVVDNQKKNESQRLSVKEEKEAKASIPDASKDEADHVDSLVDKPVEDRKQVDDRDQKEIGTDTFYEKSENKDRTRTSITENENKRSENKGAKTSEIEKLNKAGDQSNESSTGISKQSNEANTSTSNSSGEELTIEDFYVVNGEGKEQTFDLLSKKKRTLEKEEFLDKKTKQLLGKENRAQKKASNQRVFEQKKPSNLAQVFVQNAGLVLLNPYLLPFFDGVGLLENKQFINQETQYKAVRLLQQVIKPDEPIVEEELALNKLLCGLSPHEPVPLDITLTAEEIEECELLLVAVKEQWKVLKNTSLNGLRKAFMEREGMLAKESSPFQSGWKLSVTRVTSDILLDKLPWSISMIRLPWNEQLIHVEW